MGGRKIKKKKYCELLGSYGNDFEELGLQSSSNHAFDTE